MPAKPFRKLRIKMKAYNKRIEELKNKNVPTQPCPICGSKMYYEDGQDEIQRDGIKKIIITRGWWCGFCGEAILNGPELLNRESEFKELKKD